jgi:hypothetical protein
MPMAVRVVLVIGLLVEALVTAGCRNQATAPPSAQQAAQEPPLVSPPSAGKSVSADESR